VNSLPVRSCLIDGEAIVTDDRGLAVFEMIRNRRHEAATVLCAFDLIELDGEDLRRAPLELRKATLRGLLQQGHPGIAFNTHYIVDGAIVFKNACALGVRHRVKDAHLAGDLGDIDNFGNFGMKAMQGALGGFGIECARRYLLRRPYPLLSKLLLAGP
jgi:ATP dependent DNA ligase domain